VVVTEAQWQAQVVQLAELYGWRWYHTHDSRRSPAGFPDLVLWRERVVFAELKTDTGRLTPDQNVFRMQMLRVSGVEHYVWRPRDFDDVKAVLERRAA
jgi:hypothetical protein